VERFAQRVERAGADVAVDDSDGGKRKRRKLAALWVLRVR
jgi:hypothetical protein